MRAPSRGVSYACFGQLTTWQCLSAPGTLGADVRESSTHERTDAVSRWCKPLSSCPPAGSPLHGLFPWTAFVHSHRGSPSRNTPAECLHSGNCHVRNVRLRRGVRRTRDATGGALRPRGMDFRPSRSPWPLARGALALSRPSRDHRDRVSRPSLDRRRGGRRRRRVATARAGGKQPSPRRKVKNSPGRPDNPHPLPQT